MNQLSNLAENMQAESEQLKQTMKQQNQASLNEIMQSFKGFLERNQKQIDHFILEQENISIKMESNYQHSLHRLEDAAQERIDSVTDYRISKTLKFSVAILLIMGVFMAGMGGVAWWMGNTIKDNSQQIIQQNEVLKLGGLEMQTIKGKTYITAPYSAVKQAYVNKDNTLQVWELN